MQYKESPGKCNANLYFGSVSKHTRLKEIARRIDSCYLLSAFLKDVAISSLVSWKTKGKNDHSPIKCIISTYYSSYNFSSSTSQTLLQMLQGLVAVCFDCSFSPSISSGEAATSGPYESDGKHPQCSSIFIMPLISQIPRQRPLRKKYWHNRRLKQLHSTAQTRQRNLGTPASS